MQIFYTILKNLLTQENLLFDSNICLTSHYFFLIGQVIIMETRTILSRIKRDEANFSLNLKQQLTSKVFKIILSLWQVNTEV